MFGIFCPFDTLSSLLRTDRFLGDARFDLQINIIPRGSEETMVMGFFLKSRIVPISCKVCLSSIRWYKGA